jgi:uncharacterized membrane protein YhaH (DUF805 family)
MDFNYLFTSLDGRINRAKWWAGLIIIAIIGIAAGLIVGLLFGDGIAARIILFIVQLVLLYPGYAVSGKRFQDRDKPAMYALVGIAIGLLYALLALFGAVGAGAPGEVGALDWIFMLAFLAVGIWYLIELGILKGTAGPNQYGPDPLGAAAVAA